MTKYKFEIVDTGDSGCEEIRLNGQYLASTNHHEHGWQGMETVRYVVSKIAKMIGGTVETIYEYEDEEDDGEVA